MHKLQTFRVNAGLSRLQLAKKSGIAYETIRQIEHNSNRYIRVETAAQLAHALGKQISEVFDMSYTSEHGRPPQTGVGITRINHNYYTTCNICNYITPRNQKQCTQCGTDIHSTA